ncbi:MAG TPA: NAD/NADP octopine/nopaline dehydrogenase family protein, partial [Anaerolineales bacterium]
LGLEVVTLDDLYTEAGSSPNVYRAPEELPPGLQWDFRDPVKPRHIDESVPFGLVFIVSLGKSLGVPTPIAESLVHLAQALKGEDFWSSGRTVQTMGIAEFDHEELLQYLREGMAGAPI